MPLTETALRRIGPKPVKFKVQDRDGLFLEVQPSGTMTFKLRRQVAGTRRVVAVGRVTASFRLSHARARADELREDAALWRGPRLVLPDDDIDLLGPEPNRTGEWSVVAEMIRAKAKAEGKSEKTLSKLHYHIEHASSLNGKLLSQITALDLIETLRPLNEAGKYETAKRVRAFMGRVFRLGVPHGWCDRDVAADIKDAMIVPEVRSHPAITDPQRLCALLRAIDADSGAPATRNSLRLAALTFLRPSELREARWSEIDLDAARWDIPAERMKGRKRAHVVPLSRQAVEVLREQARFSHNYEFVFPQTRGDAPMSAATQGLALVRLGFERDEHVPHGFRSTASTALYEAGWPEQWIETQLHHATGSEVSQKYNRAKYLAGRTEMMQRYADWLDTVRAGEAKSYDGLTYEGS